MSDLNAISSVRAHKIQSKPKASIAGAECSMKTGDTQRTPELQSLEVKKQEADHAFALMMEVRQEIEEAYKKLVKEN